MSAVAVIDRTFALRRTAEVLGIAIAESEAPRLGRLLLAQSLRRAVFIAAPCEEQTARSLSLAALAPLTDDVAALKEQIGDTLQDLISMGDIFEQRTDLGERSEVILRPAPPAFVLRRDGSLLIIGIAGDEITPTLETPVVYYPSGLRSVRPADAHLCRSALLDLGLIELSERTWLHPPGTISAAEHVAAWSARLPTDLRPEKIEDLEILDTAAPVSFYKGRWCPLHAKHEGIFVARRPQRYGAKLWCLAEVKDGIVQRFADIRARDSRSRDCDEAWRLQAAMDAVAGTPQRVGLAVNGLAATLSFSAPLPAWAARHLSFLGQQVPPSRALLAFEIPAENAADELRWLSEKLWLAQNDEGGVA